MSEMEIRMTVSEDPFAGELFSRLYLASSEPKDDCPYFRTRLMAQFYKMSKEANIESDVANQIEEEIGVTVGRIGVYGGLDFRRFFDRSELRHVLSAITIVSRVLRARSAHLETKWVDFVTRAFSEENMRYRIEPAGGIRYIIDAEFERNLNATMVCLTEPRYGAVAKAFDSSQKRLGSQPFDGKAAIRDIFEAAETLAKLIANTGAGLTERFVNEHLQPAINRAFANDMFSGTTANRLALGFADWIQAAHRYRHGQMVETPIDPPDDIVIFMISQGAASIRWLVDLDRRVNRP